MRRGQPRRWAVEPYTDKELSCVALRVEGIKPEENTQRNFTFRDPLMAPSENNDITFYYRKAVLPEH